ncbi:MAG: hypothetical protein CFE34_11715 [Rhodobacteraceae bacterium PARR1]|nr:MAG: hypothetical protein CFE34_11715 [Rhodobacteraceae bacterium PARR1]
MTLTDLALSQFMDPFRIALLIGPVVTMQRTVAITGRVIPLLAGFACVAVIIPSTITQGLAADYVTQIGVGVDTHAVILGVKALVDRRTAG